MTLRFFARVAACFVVLGASSAAHAESATDVSPICTTVFDEAGPRTLLSRGSYCFRSNVMEHVSSNPERTAETRADVEAYMYSDNALNQLSWDIKLRFRTKPVAGEWVPLQVKPYIDCAGLCTVSAAPTIDLMPGGLTSEATITLTTDPDDPPGPCNCDEYPFASTREGASRASFSVKRIDALDNQRAGARLGNFFTSQRVIDGDTFYVNITD